jgi:cation diffusion facilitator family transporter
MAKSISDIRVVATSLTVSVSDVALNFFVALLTGSTVMLTQALQGLSDLVTAGILYIGVRRSRRIADLKYQFGYGREIFFWVLIAGIFMFIGTGALSVYFGYQQFSHPEPIEYTGVAFAMLVLGVLTNLYAFSLSLRRMHKFDIAKGWRHQLLHSSIVETKATFLIDFLGTTAAFFGFITLLAYVFTGDAKFDGLGSMIIGLSMMLVSTLLIRDVRDLIVGKAVDPEVSERIIGATQTVEGIQSVLDLRTMYLGSAKLLVIIEVHVTDDLNTDQIEKIVDNVKTVVQQNVPEVHHIQVEVETPDEEVLHG